MPTEQTTTDATASWNPIDTVPHDSPVLVYTAKWGTIIATYASEHDEWLSRMQVPVSIKEEDDLPTHWQPLPEPPPEAAGQDDKDGPTAGAPAEVEKAA